MKRYTREQFLCYLNEKITDKDPILMSGVGNGLSAKFMEKGGIDIIGVYNSCKYRINGYGSLAGMLPLGNANELVYEMGTRDILPQVKKVPVIAGTNLNDCTMDMRLYLESLVEAGFCGIHNFPTVAWFDGVFRETLEATGLGFGVEIENFKIAKEVGLVTFGYAFNKEDTKDMMSKAQVDVFVFHAGITKGGTTGVTEVETIEETARRSQECYDIAREAKKDVILLAHGAALADPEDARFMMQHTDASGIQLGSAIERLAIEVPLYERTKAFKEEMRV